MLRENNTNTLPIPAKKKYTEKDLKENFCEKTENSFNCNECKYKKYKNFCQDNGDCIVLQEYKAYLEKRLLNILNEE